jgi:hypothetical protein
MKLACVISVLLLPLFAATAKAQDVSVQGTTYRTAGAGYEPLGGVQIVVTRGRDVVGSSVSGANGHFQLSVRPGDPFIVVFYGDQRVPELQELAGKGGINDNVHVTLFSPEEYQQQLGDNVLLSEKMRCDMARVPAAAEGVHVYVRNLKLK